MFYLDCTKSQQVWSGSEPKVWFLLCFTRTIVLLSSYWAESHDTPVVEIITYSFLSLVTWDKCCIFSSAAYPVDAMTWPGYISTSTLPSCCAMGARIYTNIAILLCHAGQESSDHSYPDVAEVRPGSVRFNNDIREQALSLSKEVLTTVGL